MSYITWIDRFIIAVMALLLGISILLSVQPGIDVWMPFIQLSLNSILLVLGALRLYFDPKINITPALFFIVLLLIWSGGSFFLPSIQSPPAHHGLICS